MKQEERTLRPPGRLLKAASRPDESPIQPTSAKVAAVSGAAPG